jgi:hypothetical protein
LQTFDSENNLLGTVIGDPNTDGSTGTSAFVSWSGSGIESVTLSSTPGYFVLDDMTIDTGAAATPEPSSFALFTTLLVLIALRLPEELKARRGAVIENGKSSAP